MAFLFALCVTIVLKQHMDVAGAVDAHPGEVSRSDDVETPLNNHGNWQLCKLAIDDMKSNTEQQLAAMRQTIADQHELITDQKQAMTTMEANHEQAMAAMQQTCADEDRKDTAMKQMIIDMQSTNQQAFTTIQQQIYAVNTTHRLQARKSYTTM
jgi:hypothetical protein